MRHTDASIGQQATPRGVNLSKKDKWSILKGRGVGVFLGEQSKQSQGLKGTVNAIISGN